MYLKTFPFLIYIYRLICNHTLSFNQLIFHSINSWNILLFKLIFF